MAEEHWLADPIFVVENFFSPAECTKYIRIGEDLGYEDALVSSPQGQVLHRGLRNNQRVMLKNEEIALWLWRRAREFVPQEYDGRPAVGVNELLRFYRYDTGGQFDWHQDFPFERENGEQSYLTFMIYLNDDFEGGQTLFEDSYSDCSFDDLQVTPKQGMALFFEHETHHKGELVTEGRKYVLRTDVMYASEDELEGYDGDVELG